MTDDADRVNVCNCSAISTKALGKADFCVEGIESGCNEHKLINSRILYFTALILKILQ